MGSSGVLLERDGALADLHSGLARVREGRGEVAIVTGEAGAGKTSVIAEFLGRAAGRPTVLVGACDPLVAPRPLGPLIDAVGGIDPDLALRLAAGTTRAEAFATALTLLDGTRSAPGATVLVVEDVHWADDATLDLVTFLGRRIGSLPAMLVLSYREDEVDHDHPLRPRLGDVASSIRCRVRLPPLSREAVAELATGTPIDPDDLHRLTGGNAFYVTEVVGAGAGAVPESVRDAVLARASRLPESARTVLDAAAIVPGRAERWLLDALAGNVDTTPGVDVCIERGLLRPDRSGALTFRHELARLAIDDALGRRRRRSFHARAVAALRSPPVGTPDDARIAHHAAGADDAAAVLHHSPVAAAEASAVGAHREAARHLESALRYEELIDASTLAALLIRYGGELTMLARSRAALDAFERASRLFLGLGDVEHAAEATAKMSRPLTSLGRQPEAEERIEDAARMIADRPASSVSALVATNLAANHMLARRLVECEVEAQRAIAMAEQLDDDDVLAEACIQTGIGLAMSGDDAGLARIRRGIEIAARAGNDHIVALGYSQIGSGYGEVRRYDVAVPAMREGIEFAEARELVGSINYMSAWLARCELELGEWDDAAERASRLLRSPRVNGISRFVALVTLGWLRARRGDPGAGQLLDEALELARSTGHIQRLWPVAACRAEVAWLDGRPGDELDLVDEAAEIAVAVQWHPAIEELAHWRALATDTPVGVPHPAHTPFGSSAAGDQLGAAARWDQLGCPYEAAVARAATGVPHELQIALGTFERLGASPMRDRTAAALRQLGVTVPRGPTPGTRRNPRALTDRELEVLALVATGRTNREIGDELGITPKTVGHHVSHVLAKLGVRTRAEAAVMAERLGLTPPT